MRTAILLATVSFVILSGCAPAADPPPNTVKLHSSLICPGLPLVECKNPVYSISLEAIVNAKGEGRGTLTLNVTPPDYDEYGDIVTGTETDQVDRRRHKPIPSVSLECKLELIRKGWVGRVNRSPTERSVFSIEGPKIRSSLFIATTGPGLTSGRLLVNGKDEHVEFVVELTEPKPLIDDRPPPPCHPGCFPAGTSIVLPEGFKPIETIRVGDVLISVDKEGKAARAAVEKLFTTTNRLVEVKTDNGTAVTTDAQPFCLTDGQFRKAGELKAGDRVWQWRDGRRVEAVVRAVVPTGREERVFNVILGDSKMFVAGGFLVRGKPPAESGPAAAANPGHSAGHGKE